MTVVQILYYFLVSSYIFPDADGDGIDDRWDACDDEPENFNNYLDD